MSNIRGIKPRGGQKMDRYLVMSQLMQKVFNFGAGEGRLDLPRDIFVIAYHRRFVKKSEYLFSQHVPQLIAYPLVFSLPTIPSGRRIYDEVWASAHVLLKSTSRYHRSNSRWWETKKWRDILNSKKGIYQPYVLKAVDRTGYVCALCHW